MLPLTLYIFQRVVTLLCSCVHHAACVLVNVYVTCIEKVCLRGINLYCVYTAVILYKSVITKLPMMGNSGPRAIISFIFFIFVAFIANLQMGQSVLYRAYVRSLCSPRA